MAHSLQALARGDLDVATGEKEVLLFLDTTGDVGQAYLAFTTFLWHAVSERRKDNELRHWHRLIEDVSFRARKTGKEDVSERLRALADVLTVSIAISDRPTKDDVLKRAHVPELLEALAGSAERPTSRADLREQVPLQSANLSRLLTLLSLCGLVERHQRGKEASFQLTESGMACVRQRKTKDAGAREDIQSHRVFGEKKEVLVKGRVYKGPASGGFRRIKSTPPGGGEIESYPSGALTLMEVPTEFPEHRFTVSGSNESNNRERRKAAVGQS